MYEAFMAWGQSLMPFNHIEAAALIGAAILFGFGLAVVGLKILDDLIGDYREFKRRRIRISRNRNDKQFKMGFALIAAMALSAVAMLLVVIIH